MCVGETTFVTPENADSVVGDGRELDLLFQFDFMDLDGRDGKWNVIPFDLKKFKQLLVRWQEAIDWNTLFWGNHDQPRVVSRFGSDASEALRGGTFRLLLPEHPQLLAYERACGKEHIRVLSRLPGSAASGREY